MRLLLILLSVLAITAPATFGQTPDALRAPAPEGPQLIRPEGTNPTPTARQRTEVEPRQVLLNTATAWVSEDLSTLLSAFGDRRVAIDLGAAGKTGEYGPAQAHFLFKRLFRRTETREFTLKRYRPQPDAPHAVFDWHYLDERDGGARRVRLVISLRKEAGTWVIDEIRSTSRR